jgi:hypothetical protein
MTTRNGFISEFAFLIPHFLIPYDSYTLETDLCLRNHTISNLTETAGVGIKTTDVSMETATVRMKTTNIRMETASVRMKTTNVSMETTSVRIKITNVYTQTTRVRMKTTNVRMKITDVHMKKTGVRMDLQQKHGSLQRAALRDKKRKTYPEKPGNKQK